MQEGRLTKDHGDILRDVCKTNTGIALLFLQCACQNTSEAHADCEVFTCHCLINVYKKTL